MIKFFRIAGASLALVSAAGAVQAQDAGGGVYGELGVEAFDFFGASGNVVGRIGYDFAASGSDIGKYFAVEGEGAVGVIDDNDGFKTDYRLAGFGRVKAPIGEQFEVFGRLGYHYFDSEFGDADGAAYGGGIQYFFDPDKKNSIRLDYTRLDFDDDFNADFTAETYAIVVSRRF